MTLGIAKLQNTFYKNTKKKLKKLYTRKKPTKKNKAQSRLQK